MTTRCKHEGPVGNRRSWRWLHLPKDPQPFTNDTGSLPNQGCVDLDAASYYVLGVLAVESRERTS